MRCDEDSCSDDGYICSDDGLSDRLDNAVFYLTGGREFILEDFPAERIRINDGINRSLVVYSLANKFATILLEQGRVKPKKIPKLARKMAKEFLKIFPVTDEIPRLNLKLEVLEEKIDETA